MATYITGTSNYPGQYDVVPTNTGTSASVSFVLDQLRDPITGVISQSGDTVIAKAINNIYTIVQAVEGTLGINPQDIFSTVTERLNYLQNSGSSAFVTKSGSSMFGTLTIAGSGTEGLNTNYITTSGLDWNALGNSSIHGSGIITMTALGGFGINSNNNATVTSNGFIVNSNVTSIYGTGSVTASGATVDLLSAGNITVHSSVVPGSSGTLNLGSASTPFATIYANSIVSTGATGGFLAKSGDTMLGTLNLASGVDVTNATSGINSLGSLASPFANIYTKNIYATNVFGMSPVTLQSNLNLSTGSNITFDGSGVTNIGTAASPVGIIYANNIVASAGVSSSAYVTVTGSRMSGDLIMNSGVNIQLASGSIYPQTSGVGTVGTSGNHFANVFTDSINGRTVGNMIFGESLTVATGTIGTTRAFSFQYAPTSGYAMVFVSGVLIRPALDYNLSGTLLTITGSMYTPGTVPVAGLYIY